MVAEYESPPKLEGTLMGTPNREPQEYGRNLIEYNGPGRYIPIIFLLYSWGSLFGVPIRVPLTLTCKFLSVSVKPTYELQSKLPLKGVK